MTEARTFCDEMCATCLHNDRLCAQTFERAQDQLGGWDPIRAKAMTKILFCRNYTERKEGAGD